MPTTTRSAAVSKPATSTGVEKQENPKTAKLQREKTRLALEKQIKDGKGGSLDQMVNLQQQVADLADLDRTDRMETDDPQTDGDPTSNPPVQYPSLDGSATSNTTRNQPSTQSAQTHEDATGTSGPVSNSRTPNPAGLVPSPDNSGVPQATPPRDEMGELCVGMGALEMHNGTPVAWRRLRNGEIGLIVQCGPITACVYEMETVGKGYQTQGLMPHEELSTSDYTFKGVQGVVHYAGGLMDVKVKMASPAGLGSHWITRTNYQRFVKKAQAIHWLVDTWEFQESAYASQNPGYQPKPFPRLGRRKAGGS